MQNVMSNLFYILQIILICSKKINYLHITCFTIVTTCCKDIPHSMPKYFILQRMSSVRPQLFKIHFEYVLKKFFFSVLLWILSIAFSVTSIIIFHWLLNQEALERKTSNRTIYRNEQKSQKKTESRSIKKFYDFKMNLTFETSATAT